MPEPAPKVFYLFIAVQFTLALADNATLMGIIDLSRQYGLANALAMPLEGLDERL